MLGCSKPCLCRTLITTLLSMCSNVVIRRRTSVSGRLTSYRASHDIMEGFGHSSSCVQHHSHLLSAQRYFGCRPRAAKFVSGQKSRYTVNHLLLKIALHSIMPSSLSWPKRNNANLRYEQDSFNDHLNTLTTPHATHRGDSPLQFLASSTTT
jgi:hypothetical protein